MPLPLILAAGAAIVAAAIIWDDEEEEEEEYHVEYYENGQVKSVTLTCRSKRSRKLGASVPLPILTTLPSSTNLMGPILLKRSLRKYFAGELGVPVSDIKRVEKLA